MSSPWETSPEAGWLRTGSTLFAQALAGVSSEQLTEDSLLPHWSRAYVVSHVCANAQAIGRLLYWAETGVATPMYPSMEERDREIAEGSTLSLTELTTWYLESDSAIHQAFANLSYDAWEHRVVTAQGREVPAVETLWMRSREVCIHAVDINLGVTFSDLPEGFLARLAGEATTRHSANPELRGSISLSTDDGLTAWQIGHGNADEAVSGSLADLTQWLVGRGAHRLQTISGSPVPTLPKWL